MSLPDMSQQMADNDDDNNTGYLSCPEIMEDDSDNDDESTVDDQEEDNDDSSESTIDLDDDIFITGLAARVRSSHILIRRVAEKRNIHSDDDDEGKNVDITTSTAENSSLGSSGSSGQDIVETNTKRVRFGSVHQRRFRMTMGKNPCADGIPMELSWDYSSLRPDDSLRSEEEPKNDKKKKRTNHRYFATVFEHEKQRQGLRRIAKETRNRIALRNHSTGSVLNLMDEMKKIRIGRKKSADE